jgi:5-methylcytosine-specific restriction enzyme subunit McrC
MLGAAVTAQPIHRSTLSEALRALDRRTSAYRPAFTIIELLLGDLGVALGDQGTQVRLRGFLFDMNRFFQALISRFLREHLSDVDVQDEFRLKGMFKYVPGQNPLYRREPILRPDFVIKHRGQMLAVLDAKYRDLWETSLPRDMLYQLALYALGRVSGERLSAIIYPAVDDTAREQQIAIQEPVYGVPQARIALRPLNLLKLDQLLRGGLASQSQRVTFARKLAFG